MTKNATPKKIKLEITGAMARKSKSGAGKKTKVQPKFKRHRKLLRDNIQGVTKPAIQRLCRRAGIKFVSGMLYDEVRSVLKIKLENVLRSTVTFTDHSRRKTIQTGDVLNGIQASGGGLLATSGVKKEILGQISFRVFIQKILKSVHPDSGISGQALDEINSIIFYAGKAIAKQAEELAAQSGRSTISSREIASAVRLLFVGEVAKHAIAEGTKAVTKFSSNDSNGGKSAARAGLLIPPSLARRYFGSKKGKTKVQKFMVGTNMRVGSLAPVFLAATLEYLTAEIIELSGNAARDNKRQRINVRHLFLAVGGDEELKEIIFNRLRVVLGSSGVLPFIHSSLLTTKKTKRISKSSKEKKGVAPHRFKPGTVALREIRQMQKSTDFLIRREPFKRLVREITQDYKEDARFTASSLKSLQEYSESYLVDILSVANLQAIHRGAKKVEPKDIHMSLMVVKTF